jgi:hypothetical protein
VSWASVIETDAGFDGVFYALYFNIITSAGHATFEEAKAAILAQLTPGPTFTDEEPDFLSVASDTIPPPPPKPPRSRARSKVDVVHHRGRTGRHHGRYYYTVTGETEGAIKHAARRIFKEMAGYGILFGEVETIDGVLTLKGECSDNCE